MTMLCLTLIHMSALPAADAEVFDIRTAMGWIQHPVFADHEPVEVLRAGSGARPASDLRNVHTFYRKEFELPAAAATATLTVTGDDYVKLYINGEQAYQGPEPGYPWAYPVHEVDVTRHLRGGRNSIAIHGYYQGLVNRVWNSGDNRSGAMARLEVGLADGETVVVATDESWRCTICDAWGEADPFGYDTQFPEHIDMRRVPVGWRDVGFDDSGWDTARVVRQDHAFQRATTPPLQRVTVRPVQTVDLGDGRYFYDFGMEIVGHTRIRIQGPAGHVIDVRHGEELTGTAPYEVRYNMRAGCAYQDLITLSGATDVIELYDYKGFRYIEIVHAPSEPEVWVDVRHHPFDPERAELNTDHELLDRIWEICRNALWMGSQGGFLDCPTREKGQYVGDALIASKGHLLLTADPSLSLKALQDFHNSQRVCPSLLGVAPGAFWQEIAEYSLQYAMLLRNYYLLTGDRYNAYLLVSRALPPMFHWYAQFETESGLLSGVDGKWVLVDWPGNMRDDYDYDYAASRENAVVNAFYYAALRAAAETAEAVGLDGAPYARKAERVAEAFNAELWDAAQGVYVDAPGSAHASLHANALPLAFGMVPPERVEGVLTLIREKRLSCGVYIAPFVIEACYEAGAPDLGYALLTSTDERSWTEMLRHGATTSMEAWGPDQKANTSWCHPWSSSPIYLVVERVLGLTPATAGWDDVRFAPRIPEQLSEISLTIAVPQGRITVDYARGDGFRIQTPPGTRVHPAETLTEPVEVIESIAHGPGVLAADQRELLRRYGWDERVGSDEAAVWISVREQRFRIVRGDAVVWEVPCATATNGVGSVVNSYQTPPGWHRISGKLGDDAPWGQVFRSRNAGDEVWRPGDAMDEDLVLTRVLLLDGLDPGINQGGEVDSAARYIYIHGTNGEADIGRPSSHGCIRLRNNDVIAAFERVDEGALVLITPE